MAAMLTPDAGRIEVFGVDIAHLSRRAVRPDRAVIVVTHDERIFRFADRIATMADGRIEHVAEPETVF
jgi:ABC-type sulfate/molybdate transport systems ATPase subunit